MNKYFITYNDLTNLDVDLLIVDRPSKPSPLMEYETIQVPGGKTLYKEKGYSDIEITISFNFMSREDSWDYHFRRIKKWLLSKGDSKLKFADDMDFYYKVNKVNITSPERELRTLGKFEATFICDPFVYADTGEIKLGATLFNEYLMSKPVYRVVGEGYLTLNVNGNKIKANVGQELLIDTDKGLCYRKGIINNVALEGRFEDMFLIEGENKFSWNKGFDIYILPNLRCL